MPASFTYFNAKEAIRQANILSSYKLTISPDVTLAVTSDTNHAVFGSMNLSMKYLTIASTT